MERIRMIYLNTFHYERDKSKYRNNIEDLFATTVMNEELDERDKELLRIIDNATYVNEDTIIGFNGCTTTINNISRGLKTILVIRWFIKHNKPDISFDISSCGDNVLAELIKEIKDRDVYLLTCNYIMDVDEKVPITVNNKYKVESLSEIVSLGRKLNEPEN